MKFYVKGYFLKEDKGYDTKDGKHVPACVIFDGSRETVLVHGMSSNGLKPMQQVDVPVTVRNGDYGLFVSLHKD